jgi:hypothetical protein
MVQDYFTDIGLHFLRENKDLVQGDIKVDYTFMSTANGTIAVSTIDHFACSMSVFPIISEAGVINSGENNSNHSATFSKLSIGDIALKKEKIESSKHVDWSAATSGARAEYKTKLAEHLNSISLPDCVLCQDVHCRDHTENIEQYTLDILETTHARLV